MSLIARQRLQRHLRTLNQQTNNEQLMRTNRVQSRLMNPQRRIESRNDPRMRIDELREPIRRRILSRERMNDLSNQNIVPNQNDVLRRIRDVRNNRNEQYDDYYDDYDGYNDDYYDDYNEKPIRQPMNRNSINQQIGNNQQRLTLRSMQRESLNRNTKMNTNDQFMDLYSPEYNEPNNGRIQQSLSKNPNNNSTNNNQNNDNYDDYDPNNDYNENDYDYSSHQSIHSNKNLRNNSDINSTNGNIQPNELSKEIQERYNELIKELWNNEQKINIYELPQALKEAMNERMKLWLEYFLTNSSFRTSDTNMFEYLDTFTNTTSFI